MTNLDRNLQALVGVDPLLAQALRQVKPLAETVVVNEDGSRSARIGDSGEGLWIQSRRGPRRESERLIEVLSPNEIKAMVLVGAGCGYAIEEALKRAPKLCVLVIEPDFQVLRFALENVDLSKPLAEGRVGLLNDLPTRPATDVVLHFGMRLALQGTFTLEHAYARQIPSYAEARRWVSEGLQRFQTAMSSQFAGMRVYTANVLRNLPVYLHSAGVTQMRGKLEGVGAVICGAGPSLAANLAQLKPYQDQCFIFALSSSLKRVLSEGLRVDATNVVDYSHLSTRYFSGVTKGPPIFAEGSAHPKVFDAYDGPVAMLGRDVYRALLRNTVPDHGEIAGDSSNVALSAFKILRYLGCNPIILTGMDQAFSYHITHTPGAAMYDEFVGSASRFNSLESNELIAITCGVDRTSAGLDIHGNPLLTDQQMNDSALTFEAFFARYADTKVYNATQGGRRLRGTHDAPLEEVLAGLEGRPFDVAMWQSLSAPPPAPDEAAKSAIRARLQQVAAWGRELKALLESALEDFKKADKRLVKTGETGDLGRTVKILNEFPLKDREVFAVVRSLAQSDLFERDRELARLDAQTELSRVERVRAKLRLEVDYVRAILNALRFWQEALEDGITRTEAVWAGRPLSYDELTFAGDGDQRVDGAERRPVIDAIIEWSDDAAQRQAFIGDGAFSPLRNALQVLTTQAAVREVVLPWDANWGEAPVGERVRLVPYAPAGRDLTGRSEAKRLMRWSGVGTLRGLCMATYLGLVGNPYATLVAIRQDPIAGYVMVVPSSTSFLTREVVGHFLQAGDESHWQQAMYLGEGPQGLLPVLWETEALIEVGQKDVRTQAAFIDIQNFWGKSFTHVPTEVIQCRRNFSLANARGRSFVRSLADQVAAPSNTLAAIIEAGWQAGEAWAGDGPRDLEIELCANRPFEPAWLPTIKRERDSADPAVVADIIEEFAGLTPGGALTFGGFGETLQYPGLVELIARATKLGLGVNVRTFGLHLNEKLYSEMKEAGLEVLTVQLGAFGTEAYRSLGGPSQHHDSLVQFLMGLVRHNLSQGSQLPMIVPEVVKSREGDRTLVAFRDAFWSPGSWPNVTGWATYGDALPLNTAVPLAPGRRRPCIRLSEQMLVLCDGRVPLCRMDANAAKMIGRVPESSLSQLWKSARLRAARRSHDSGDFGAAWSKCTTCLDWCRLA